jgi:F420-non-reducing hydrogenase iron-sulfur subunit
MNDKSLKIYVFCCANSYDQAQLTRNFNQQGIEMEVISLPCSGKLDILYLIKAFETGADGVAVMMCQEGECQYLEGNMRARKRAEVVEKLLKEAGLGEGRVVIIQMGDCDVEPAIRKLEDFCLKITALVQGNQAKVFQPDNLYNSRVSLLNKVRRG